MIFRDNLYRFAGTPLVIFTVNRSEVINPSTACPAAEYWISPEGSLASVEIRVPEVLEIST